MLRPTMTILRLCLMVQSTICWIREILLEKVEMIRRLGALSKISLIESKTFFSLGVQPSFSAFVESASNKSTPSWPKRDILWSSKSGPTGVKSSLKSPVSTILPSGVSTQIPKLSGIEWVTRIKLTLKQPAVITLSWSYSTSLTFSLIFWSSNFCLIKAQANFGA